LEVRIEYRTFRKKGERQMDLKKYFGSRKGIGVLSTADEKGKVNAAVYSKPHVIDDKHVSFIMADRLTHANTNKNPFATFLFKEDGKGYKGKRLYLKKKNETENQELIAETCKIEYAGSICEPRYLKKTFLVTFSVQSVLPLLGKKSR
jgi:hypothetical protein